RSRAGRWRRGRPCRLIARRRRRPAGYGTTAWLTTSAADDDGPGSAAPALAATGPVAGGRRVAAVDLGFRRGAAAGWGLVVPGLGVLRALAAAAAATVARHRGAGRRPVRSRLRGAGAVGR